MYQVGQACYTTLAAANSAAASAHVGHVLAGPGGSLVALDVSAVSDTSITYSVQPMAPGAAPYTYTVQASPQPCQLLTGADALSLAWSVVLVWVVAFGLKLIAKYLWAEVQQSDGGTYGNT